MTRKTRKHLIGYAAALCFVAAAGAGVAVKQGAGEGYKGAMQRVEVQRKAADRACERAKPGHARDLCEAQAKAHERVARAELHARRKPGPDSDKELKYARADAEFQVASEKCEARPKYAQDKCVTEARNDRDAARRQAMIERVQELAQLKYRGSHPPKAPESDKEKYASLRAYCQMQGPTRDECLAQAKRRFHHT
jgi:hypothetical protein